MRNTTFNVSFNTEKLDALKFHMEKRDTDLQGELNDTGGVPAGRIRNRMITRIKKTESPVIHDIPV